MYRNFHWTLLVAVVSVLLLWPHNAIADAVTGWGTVTELAAGWAQDTMSVSHSAPFVNDGCRITNAGYATSPSDTGHSLFHTVLLSAFLNKKQVALRIQGCVFDKPHIIEVKIRD